MISLTRKSLKFANDTLQAYAFGKYSTENGSYSLMRACSSIELAEDGSQTNVTVTKGSVMAQNEPLTTTHSQTPAGTEYQLSTIALAKLGESLIINGETEIEYGQQFNDIIGNQDSIQLSFCKIRADESEVCSRPATVMLDKIAYVNDCEEGKVLFQDIGQGKPDCVSNSLETEGYELVAYAPYNDDLNLYLRNGETISMSSSGAEITSDTENQEKGVLVGPENGSFLKYSDLGGLEFGDDYAIEMKVNNINTNETSYFIDAPVSSGTGFSIQSHYKDTVPIPLEFVESPFLMDSKGPIIDSIPDSNDGVILAQYKNRSVGISIGNTSRSGILDSIGLAKDMTWWIGSERNKSGNSIEKYLGKKIYYIKIYKG